MCHLLFRKGHTSKSVLKRSLPHMYPTCASQQFTQKTKKKKKFKQVSHVWQVEELLSEIQDSLKYWLEEDICDDLNECEMNRGSVRARQRGSCAH